MISDKCTNDEKGKVCIASNREVAKGPVLSFKKDQLMILATVYNIMHRCLILKNKLIENLANDDLILLSMRDAN